MPAAAWWIGFLLPYASKIYNRRRNEAVAAGFKRTFCHECKPHFIGVWDTVASLAHVVPDAGIGEARGRAGGVEARSPRP